MNKQRFALISTFEKDGVVDLAVYLKEKGYQIMTTGGTHKKIATRLNALTSVTEYTDYPEYLDGRVKTLHPKIYGGILAQRSKRKHLDQLEEQGVSFIDIVVVNLYPFHLAVKDNMKMLDAQELIDIGGVSLIRAAAKNWQDVLVITDPSDYQYLMSNFDELIKDRNYRLDQAKKAFNLTFYWYKKFNKFCCNSVNLLMHLI